MCSPQVPELRHLAAGDVVGHRHARQLHDAALDGVHQREVARRPWEQRPLRVARAAQEEGCRREVDHAPEAQLPLDGFEPGDPDPRRLAVPFGFLAVVALEGPFVVFPGRLLAVAVVRLVVQDQDALHAHQARHDALQHLPFCLLGSQVRPLSPEQGASPLRQLQRLAPQERVVVGDDDLRPLQVAEHVVRHQLAARVVAVRIVGLEHPQTVADGHARGHHQEAARELPAARPAHGVDRLPGDDHRHDGGLAGTGGELQRQPRKARIGPFAGSVDLIEKPTALLAEGRRHLGQPDGGLHRLDLAEEGPDVAEPMAAPMLQQPRCLRRHLPRGRIGKLAPSIHALPHAADECGQVVLLSIGPKRLRSGIEDDLLLLDTLLLLRPRDRRDEGDLTALGEDLVRRLAAGVKLPVAGRVLVGRVQDRLLEEGSRRHSRSKSSARARNSKRRRGPLCCWPVTDEQQAHARAHPPGRDAARGSRRARH